MTTIAKRGPLSGLFLAAILALAACGGDDAPSRTVAPETTASAAGGTDFCEQVSGLDDGIDLQSERSDLATFGMVHRRTSANMRAIDPPAEIANEWHTAADTMSEVGALIGEYDLSDPEEVQQLEGKLAGMQAESDALDAAWEKIGAYGEKQGCWGNTEPPAPDTVP